MVRKIRRPVWMMISCLLACSIKFTYAQVGIGIATPQARLHVYDGSFLSQTPTLSPETSPFYDPVKFDTDPVTHMFKWMHGMNAFRAVGSGAINLDVDPANVGNYSFATGFDAHAVGIGSAAFGMRVTAGKSGAFAGGQYSIGGGTFSFGHGYFSSANGPNCLALGTNLSSNYQTGSFIMGYDVFSGQSTADNQIKLLFAGGIRFFTNHTLTSGVMLAPGDNAWSVISDVRGKENFAAVRKKDVLSKIRVMPLVSWNYKGQDSVKTRHYGPMAQDFFTAFGSDEYGIVGTDTTINQSDLDGVTLMAIQALVHETDELLRMNEVLESELMNLEIRLSAIPCKRKEKAGFLTTKN